MEGEGGCSVAERRYVNGILEIQTGKVIVCFCFCLDFVFWFFFFFFCLHSMQDLSSSTRDQTHTPCTGNLVSQLPDGQRSLRRPLF